MSAKATFIILSLALHMYIPQLVEASIDYSICNPLDNSTVPTPMPELAKSFTANIEWKWIGKNRSIDVREVHNGILNVGSQTIEEEGQTILIIYDYVESQYITYTPGAGCAVKGLGTLAFYQDKVWLSATPMIYNIVKLAGATYNGTYTVRSTTVGKWHVCLDLFQYNITLDISLYFSANGWGMAMSNPAQMVPVRVEMKGSQNYNKDSTDGYNTFHVIGDFIDYNPKPTIDETQLQLPAGTYCPGRKSRKPLELFPSSFSLVMEKIDMDYHKVTYEYIWYDAANRLIRRDYKEASNQDLDPTAEVFDFNLGIHYSIDKYMGTCQPVSLLSYGDLFVKRNGNSSRMESALEFFHAKKSVHQYVGARTTRGVSCDVWVGVYPDDTTGTNLTIEWYFSKSDWQTAIGGVVQSQTLFRMDIWEGGSNKPVVYNVLQLDKDAPSLSMFDISLCYPAEHKTRILLHFSVVNGGKLSTVGMSYLTDTMHIQLTKVALIPPLRLTDLTVIVAGDSDLYVDAILLDNAPVENHNLVPPPPKQHPLSGVLGFLTGTVLGGFTISINSTTSKTPVIVKSRAIQEINYAERFTTTKPTTTHSTTLATPPAPKTSMNVPSVQTPPLPPVTVPLSPSTIPPLTSQQTPCPQCICTTKTCPPTTCPTQQSCTKTTCPPCPSGTPCPKQSCPQCMCTKNTCPPPKTCPTRQPCTITQALCSTASCPKTTCSPCAAVTPCPKSVCPSSHCNNTCPVCPPQSNCPQTSPCSTQCPKVTCPPCLHSPVTPCPTSLVHIPTPGQQAGASKGGGSKGLSGGVVAAIAISMILVGLLLGVIGLRMYQRYTLTTGTERKTILDNYLNDNERY